MARTATATPTKKPGTAVAQAKGTALVSMQDAIKKELAEVASRTGAPGGDVIRLTKTKRFKLPDGQEVSELPAVIVDHVTYRRFYDKPFDPQKPSPPACFAVSVTPTDMAPPKDVPVRQSDKCSSCPMNEFGSGVNGKGKACKETRDLAVLPPDADAETEIAVVSVSPTGLKSYDGYVRTIAASLQKATFQVVTEITMDEASEHQSLRFGNPQPASPDLQLVAFNARAGARERLMAYPDTSQYEAPKAKGRSQVGGRR